MFERVMGYPRIYGGHLGEIASETTGASARASDVLTDRVSTG